MSQMEMFDNEGAWLARMRKTWQENIRKDTTYCPCCDRPGRVNKHRLTKVLALTLRWIMAHGSDDGWVNVQSKAPRWILRSKTYSLLEHWGLVESKSFRSGIWRITPKGASFVTGIITVPEAAYVYDAKVVAWEPVQTTFRACFDHSFDFDAMMSETYDWSSLIIEPSPKPKRRRK
jgi:hypothetical protein